MKIRRDFIKKIAALTTGVGLTNGLLAENISTDIIQETETEIGKKNRNNLNYCANYRCALSDKCT